ncbi:hypothetical protein RV03_GL000851 [Enterococcus gallinarum]|nr:hypothetical protein RV03_GL000851 [Enterococcus gallinarum]
MSGIFALKKVMADLFALERKYFFLSIRNYISERVGRRNI